MKYLYSWLKEFAPQLPTISDLVPLLIQLGHDVESVTPLTYEGVVVAEILEVLPHPNADRLKLVRVTVGSEEKVVVCGAPNVSVGLKVPYAALGTTLPCGLTLKPIKIRGEISDGMLCAEDELGIGTSHEGLLILPSEAGVGAPITDFVPKDHILSLDITPTRGDVLSHFGLARDIIAATEERVLTPQVTEPQTSDTQTRVTLGSVHADAVAISIAVAEADQSGVTPLYIASRLFLLGQKPINLPTDITNYIMLEYGQPLHAYDAHSIGDHPTIGVRRAQPQEPFVTLGEHVYTLSPQALVITNNDKPIALAGVMGGEATKSTETTQSVVFEAARFNQKTITLASRGLNLITDSSLRFERGVDPHITPIALARALSLWQEITQGHVSTPITHENSTETQKANEVSESFVAERLGIAIPEVKLQTRLTSLGCIVESHEETYTVTPPSWRFDLHYPEDYVEEIMRLLGTERIPAKPLAATVPQWKRSEYWRQEYIKDLFVAMGAYEIETYPFVTKEEQQMFGNADQAVQIIVPPQENRPYLRPSLVPGILTALATNPEIPFLNLFELGVVYNAAEESLRLCVGVASNSQVDVDAWWQNAFEKLKLPVASWMSRVKTINEATKDQYKLRKSVVTILEIHPDELGVNKQAEIVPVTIPDLDTVHYEALSKFQASRRDIAIIVSQSITPSLVTNALQGLDPAIVDVDLFDTYTSAKLGEDKHSLAFHVLYQASDRTLTSEEVTILHDRVISYVKEQFHATIR